MDVASVHGPVPFEPEDVLLLTEAADQGQQESEARAGDRTDSDGDPDEFAASGPSDPMAHGAGGAGFHRDSLPAIRSDFIAWRATGPPGLST